MGNFRTRRHGLRMCRRDDILIRGIPRTLVSREWPFGPAQRERLPNSTVWLDAALEVGDSGALLPQVWELVQGTMCRTSLRSRPRHWHHVVAGRCTDNALYFAGEGFECLDFLALEFIALIHSRDAL